MNSNSGALDGMFGGVTTLSFSSATSVLLTVPSTGSVSPTAGPNQSQNALLQFTGALTGNVVVQFTLPGFYIIHNQCTVGSFFVQLQPAAGTGSANAVGAPPGQKVHVFYDGSNMDYCNMPAVGSFMDMAVPTTPAWMNACTIAPYLVCDGSILTASVYPALNAVLGSTFGGNGITTFGVPDLRARYRIPLDNQGQNGAANRITAGVSGVSGVTRGAAGGNQAVTLAGGNIPIVPYSDPGHQHTVHNQVTLTGFFNSSGVSPIAIGGDAGSFGSLTNITIGNASPSAFSPLPPGLVTGMSLIKT